MPPVPQLIQRLDDATAVIPSNFEASLGPEVLAKIGPHTAQFKRISANINQSARAFNANDQEAYKNMVLEKAKVVHSNRSKKILDRETYVINMWMTVLSQNKEGLTVGQIWHTDMIKEHILTFLYYAVDAMKPLRGYGVLRSSSLGSVLYTLVSLVARYGHDPVTFTPRGHELLTNGGLYHNLQGQLFNIILTRKLDKTRRNPIFAGRDHGHLMIVTALVNSTKEPPRRLCAIQNILRLDMTFYATCRPSTLGYTEKRFRDAGAYIKLKDLTIYKKGYMEYEIKINLQYFKGALRTVHNDQQEITFKSVLYTHNILFDPVITFIAFLHLRGVFSKPYKTADELFDDPAAQLLIDSAELESPLFLKTKPGGKGLTDLAASADSHTTSTENLALAAGLPIMGPTAFRRDGGNKWSQQMGLGVAKDFLNHHEGPNVLGVHYHRRMNNFNPVGIRIGEEKGTNEAYAGEMIEKDRQMHLFKENIIEYIVRYKAFQTKEAKTQRQLAHRKEILTDPKALKLRTEISCARAEFLTCFYPMEHKMSDNCAGVTTIVNAALGTNTRKGVVFRDQAKALEMQQKLYGLYKEQSKLNRALNHALTRKDQQTRTDEYRKNEISGTAEERQEAVESLDRVQKDDVRDILTLPILEKPLRATADCPVVEINEEELDRYDDDNGSSCQLDNDVLSWADGLNRTIQVEERIIEDEIAVPKSLNLIVNQYGPLFDANEPQELADAPDVDEAVEVDVFAMDIKHVRRRFFDYLTAPARKEKQVVVIDDNIVDDVIKDAVETYPCTVCIERGFNKVFSCRSHLVRHNLQIHSKWKELEWNGIRRPGEKRFHCPSEQCSASYVALSKVFTHMLNKCRDSEKWIALKAAHQLGAKQYKGAKYVDRTDVTFIPGNHEDLIGLAEMAHWYQDDHISNAIKEDYAELAVDALRPTEPEDASLDALDWYLSSHLNRLTTAARPSTVVAKAGEPFELDGLDFKTFYSKMSTKPYTAIRPPLW